MPERLGTSKDHLSHRGLDDYFLGERSIGELGTTVFGHLADSCSECRRRLEGASISFEEAFACAEERGRAIRKDIGEERAGLPALLSELLPMGLTEAVLRVASDHRFHTVAFVEHELAIAWDGLERRASTVVSGGWTLAYVALRGLNPAHYGRMVLRRLEAELYLLQARDEVARKEHRDARASLLAAGRLLKAAGRPVDLGGLELLAAAELRLAGGRAAEARALGAAAAELLREGRRNRWLLVAERLVARIDRLEGRPRAAADRLLRLLGEAGPKDPAEWSAARELFFALIEAAEVEEAAGWLVTWWGDDDAGDAAEAPGTEEWFAAWRKKAWSHPEDHVERELVLGVLLGHLGKLGAARSLLESARRSALRLSRGRDAMVATLELLRLHNGDPVGLESDLADLHQLALCRDVPRPALRELVRVAAAVRRGKVGDIARIERVLLLDLESTSTGRSAHGLS
jgi:hypothetical protein